MADYQTIVGSSSHRWLVTGAAGFIGSNLVEALLLSGQEVVGLDNFSTGHRRNLEDVRRTVGDAAWKRFSFIEGDIRDPNQCRQAVDGARFVLHQAALGSVPRSIADPIASFDTNVNGFVQILTAARDAGVRRFVYASSSSVYGDSPELPKVEARVGRPLSPYAATKSANELFADVWARTYAMSCVGLRYFNVFGPRQDPAGAYAAVIPKWVAAMLSSGECRIHGDGQTSRDFCYIANVVQANLRAAVTDAAKADHRVFNVACGGRTTLLELHAALARACERIGGQRSPAIKPAGPVFGPFRQGDVQHSLASIDAARAALGYEPTHDIGRGIDEAIGWYAANLL